MRTEEEKQNDESRSDNQAKAQLESIKEMVAAYNCDYERLAELKEEQENFDFTLEADAIPDDFTVKVLTDEDKAQDPSTCGTCGLSWDDAVITSMTPAPAARCPFEAFHTTWDQANPEDGEELKALTEAAGDSEDREDAEQRIQEDPLSVQVRSDWHNPGDKEGAKGGQFEILLCTGGPACRIIGELNDYCEPTSAKIEHQDWGTPWTEHRMTRDEEETVLTYCRCFWFGE